MDIQPKKAVISDCNAELINAYQVVKGDVDKLIADLRTHRNTPGYYYRMRAVDPESLSSLKRASRIIYLNKTCFNGLYRVNKQGRFNVPYGKYKNPNIVNEIVLKEIYSYLTANDVIILNTDFEEVLQTSTENDFVYLDPPYDASFTKYTPVGFGEVEQIRLRSLCSDMKCKFLLSNLATSFILELYKDFRIEIVKAGRAINSKGSGRGKVDEVLIMNYSQEGGRFDD